MIHGKWYNELVFTNFHPTQGDGIFIFLKLLCTQELLFCWPRVSCFLLSYLLMFMHPYQTHINNVYTLFTLAEEDGYFYVKRKMLREIRHMNSVTVHLKPLGELLTLIQNKSMIEKQKFTEWRRPIRFCTLQQGPSEIMLEFCLSNYNGLIFVLSMIAPPSGLVSSTCWSIGVCTANHL